MCEGVSQGLSQGLKTVIKQPIIDGFPILRCLVKYFDVLLYIFPSKVVLQASLVVKNGTKKTFEKT